MVKLKGFISVCLLLAILLTLGVGLVAQDDAESSEAVADQSEGTSINLQEGLFALLVVAVVMMGLIGFEYIHRRKRSL